MLEKFRIPRTTLHTFFEAQAHILVVNDATLGADGTGFIRLNIGAPHSGITQALRAS